ncbi:CHASE2 domain-containing protein [bacterium]|nr:CHASE2 domain-containing protein [bacterium]NIN91608.1 CHASE2 domain-containing protein [bacterium]NIO17972.1 CHASE2 domain-containing protein [bacterium]NIO73740.1 CHASE2 domain-containing protein [bacterium]
MLNNYFKKFIGKIAGLIFPHRVGILLGIVVAGVIAVLYFLGVGETFELRTQDYRFQLRGERKINPVIQIVFMGDQSIKVLGRWPWRRQYHAALLHALSQYSPRVIGYDVLFIEPASDFPEDDRLFAKATKEAGNVYYPFFFTMKEERGVRVERSPRLNIEEFALNYEIRERDHFLQASEATLPIIELAASMKGTGFVNVRPDMDGTTRRVPLVMEYQRRLYPSLSLKLVSDYLGVEKNNIRVKPGQHIELRGSRLGDIKIPVDREGQMLVNYPGGIASLWTSDFIQVLQSYKQTKIGREPVIKLSDFEDKIVLVGLTATGSADLRAVPFAPLYPQVGVLASAINSVLNQDFLIPVSRGTNVLLFFLVGIIMGISIPRMRPLKGALFAFSILAVYLFLTLHSFSRRSLSLPVVYPGAIIFFSYLSTIVYKYATEEKEKKRIKSIFQRYVSSQVVDELLTSPDRIVLGGRREEISVLFADIRNFTGMASRMSPEEVVGILNEFFTMITEVIFKYNGTLDKYMGDAVMAIYGAPVEEENHAQKALETALEMQKRMGLLQKRFLERGIEPIRIGIGITTGEAVVGNIGSFRRMEYTAIGDSVNLAARLEELAKPDQVLISEKTYQMVKDIVNTRALEPMTVRGKTDLVQVYEVLGLKIR